MARKAVVDKDVILAMLKEGETTQRIAERFNVSRQAIDLHRKDFIQKGLLSDKRASRTLKTTQQDITQQEPRTDKMPPNFPSMSLDRQIDLMIDAFNALKRLPLLEREVETYKQQYEDAVREIECLKENERKRQEQESRWLDTQR